VRLLCRVNLPLDGWEVVEAPDGETALERAVAERFDLVVLDVMMPGLSGFDVARKLRQDPRTVDLPFVFLSARADEAEIRRGFELGAADYITKPFDPLRLGAQLTAVLHAVENGDTQRLRDARLGGLGGRL
jgi:DNA-binding response OmpR family regulator